MLPPYWEGTSQRGSSWVILWAGSCNSKRFPLCTWNSRLLTSYFPSICQSIGPYLQAKGRKSAVSCRKTSRSRGSLWILQGYAPLVWIFTPPLFIAMLLTHRYNRRQLPPLSSCRASCHKKIGPFRRYPERGFGSGCSGIGKAWRMWGRSPHNHEEVPGGAECYFLTSRPRECSLFRKFWHFGT